MRVWVDDDRKQGRDPARIPEVLAKLQAFWENNPQSRLGQLFWALSAKVDLFYVEDDELARLLEELTS